MKTRSLINVRQRQKKWPGHVLRGDSYMHRFGMQNGEEERLWKTECFDTGLMKCNHEEYACTKRRAQAEKSGVIGGLDLPNRQIIQKEKKRQYA